VARVYAMKAYRGVEIQPLAFITSALYLMGFVSFTLLPLCLSWREAPTKVEEAGRYLEPVWTLWRREKFISPAGCRTKTSRTSRSQPSQPKKDP